MNCIVQTSEAWATPDVVEFAHRMCAGPTGTIEPRRSFQLVQLCRIWRRSTSKWGCFDTLEVLGVLLRGLGGCHQELIKNCSHLFKWMWTVLLTSSCVLNAWSRNPPALLNPPPDQKVRQILGVGHVHMLRFFVDQDFETLLFSCSNFWLHFFPSLASRWRIRSLEVVHVQVRWYVFFEIPMKTQDSDSKMLKFLQSLSLSCWYIWDRLNFTLVSRSQVRRWTRCASAQRHGLWRLLKIAPATSGRCKEKPQRMHLKKLEKRPQHAATMWCSKSIRLMLKVFRTVLLER